MRESMRRTGNMNATEISRFCGRPLTGLPARIGGARLNDSVAPPWKVLLISFASAGSLSRRATSYSSL
ncbi:hypothetical protein ACVWZZ_006660 [Bradyrhizobium sp. LM6.10]